VNPFVGVQQPVAPGKHEHHAHSDRSVVEVVVVEGLKPDSASMKIIGKTQATLL
jgi:hypothetical protein